MNINTATILNLMSSKINPTIKDKIESLSVNGKIDLETISKDKGIQSLLSGLLKDISTGIQTKENVSHLLQHNKQNFSFKNLSEDIKTLIKFIQTNPETSGKLETQLVSLKSSLIDMKNIDEKMIKTNISNSGVFLESKLAKQVTPVSKNVEQLLALIKGQLDVSNGSLTKNNFSKDQLTVLNGAVNTNIIEQKLVQMELNTTISKDMKVEIKNAVESLLRDIKNIKTEQNPQKQLQNLSSLETKILTTQHNTSNTFLKNNIIPSVKDLFINLKEQLISKNFIEVKNGFSQLLEKVSILNEQTLGTKSITSDLSNILEQFKTLKDVKVPQQQQVILQNIFNNTQTIQTKIDTLPQVLFENNLSKTTNFINDLKITASIIEEHVKNSDEPVTKELKTIIDKINTQIDFYQLLSYSTNSSHTYLSFLQGEIEDSDIRFNKNNDNSFSCQINLTLKQYGDLKILMVLDEKNNININIGLEQEELKSLIQENLQKLRTGISSVDLMLQSLNVFSLNNKEQNSIKNGYGNSSTNDLSFGLDIKA